MPLAWLRVGPMMRVLSFVVLAFLLAVSSVGTAAMPHGTGPQGSLVVLCGSDLPVQVDLPGAPPPDTHRHCPICLGSGVMATMPAPAGCATAPISFSHVAGSFARTACNPATFRQVAQARAPPILI